VDNPTHISLCSGYGGIDLGLRRCIPSLRTVAYSEIEAFACELLLARMESGHLDPAPIWTDLKSFPWGSFRGLVDILSGGYPCQPFSAAGKRLGADDERHLWPYIANGISVLQPRLCFFENVEGHITLGLRDVMHDLGRMGYRTTWGIFSAAEVRAPHQRKRVFILAHSDCFRNAGSRDKLEPSCKAGQRRENPAENCIDGNLWPSRPREPQHAWEPPRVVGDAPKRRLAQSGANELQAGIDAAPWDTGELGNAYGAGSQEWTRERGAGVQRAHADGGADAERQTQSTLGRNADGPAGGLDYAELCDNRTDELRLLGNGVVPATAERAFRTLMKELKEAE
jgi:DNA (cytosine-5)-methyltransferase 1